MVVLDILCRARIHDSAEARARGCVCPTAWGEPFQSPPQRHRLYIAGRRENVRGARRRTDPEGDWAAVERAIAGDPPMTLSVSERDAAIDRLDDCGMSAREIAIRLRVTMRTVQRRRHARRGLAVAS